MRLRRLQAYLLFVLFVAATVPVIVFSAFQMSGLQRDLEDRRQAEFQQAQAIADSVAYYVAWNARAVQNLAQLLGTMEDPYSLDLQRVLELQRRTYPGIAGLYVGSPQGTIQVMSPATSPSGQPMAGRDFSASPLYLELTQAKDMIYSPVFAAEVTGRRPLISMIQPIRDQSGAMRFFVAGGLESSRLEDILDEHVRCPSEVILLLDERNVLIAASERSSFAPLTDLTDTTHVANLRSGVRWADQGGQAAAYATVPNLGWGVAVLSSRAEIYAPQRRTMRDSALTAALGLVLGWLLDWYLARAMNRPIAALIEAAEVVQRGSREVRPYLSQGPMPRELGELHSAFISMVSALRRSEDDLRSLNATLEQRVDERTAEVLQRSRELSVLNQTAAEVLSRHDLPGLLREMAQGIAGLVDADAGLVVLRLADGSLRLGGVYTAQGDWTGPDPEDLGRGICAEVIRTGLPVTKSGLSALPCKTCASSAPRMPEAFCGVPMRAGGVVTGALYGIRWSARPFDEHTVELLTTLSGQVSPAVSRAWLFSNVEEQRNRLLSITNSMQDGLVLADAAGNVQYANPAAAALLRISSPPEPGASLERWGAGLPTGTLEPPSHGAAAPMTHMVDLSDAGGRSRSVALTTFPVEGVEGGSEGYGILIRDVTQDRELERAKDELIANVSHDLRTPLTTIVGTATTLLRLGSALSPEEQAQLLDDMVQEGQRLRRLIEDLLDMSRITTGALDLDRSLQVWPPLLQRAVERARQRWPEHRFEVDSHADLPLLEADAVRLDQVLDNLLANAVQYSPAGSTVRVTAQEADGMILTSVADEGIGIPQGDLGQVFERFYRGAASEVRRVRGTGLGLAICRGIVESHRGRIWAESAEGAGTVIKFTLPGLEREGGDSDEQGSGPRRG